MLQIKIDTLELVPDVGLAVQANLTVIATLNLEIGKLEALPLESVALHPDYASTLFSLRSGTLAV